MKFSPDGNLLAIREASINDITPSLFSDNKYTFEEAQLSNLSPRQSTLSVWEVASGKILWRRPVMAATLDWSHDGNDLILQRSRNTIVLCEARSGQVRNGQVPSSQAVESIPSSQISADAQWFADADQREIRAMPTSGRRGWKWQLSSSELLGTLSFAPDNSWLMALGIYGVNSKSHTQANIGTGGRARFYDLETGKEINTWSGNSEDDNGAAFFTTASPRGRYLAIKRFPNVLRIWEVRTGRDFAFRWAQSVTNSTLQQNAKDENPDLFGWQGTEFSPDENLILLSGGRENMWLIDLRARTIRQTRPVLPTSSKYSIRARFTQDNQHIVWSDSTTGKMGRLSLNDFNGKVPVEIIDGATSRPE